MIEYLPLERPFVWALAVCAVAALLEGVLSGRGVSRRFSELRLPKYAPPLWAWSAVGLAYYVLSFFLLYSLLSRRGTPVWTTTALVLVAVLLSANAAWNWVFFRRKALRASTIFYVPYGLVALALALVLFRLRSPIARWFLLYVGYLGYAAWWGYSVWRLNGRPQGG